MKLYTYWSWRGGCVAMWLVPGPRKCLSFVMGCN
jgi:hypothetical protein